MFICVECIKEYWINRPNYSLSMMSYGSCEHCKKIGMCYDVPSGNYVHKDSLYGKQHTDNQLKEMGYVFQG